MQQDNPSLSANFTGVIHNDTIDIGVKQGTLKTNLQPRIIFRGKSVSPDPSQRQNFTFPIHYTVTAEDGSLASYIAFVHEMSSLKEITSFAFRQTDNPVLSEDITGVPTGDTIVLYVSDKVDLKKLIPFITYKGKSLTPETGKPVDFTGKAFYTVVAEDQSTRTYTVIVTSNRMVFTGSANGTLFSVNPVTGKVLWKVDLGGQLSSPVYDQGIVITTSYGLIYGIDAITGKQKWVTKRLADYGFSSACMQSSVVYICGRTNGGSGGSTLYALDELSGKVKWQKLISSNDYGYLSSPTYGNGMVFVGEAGAGIHGFDAASGESKWTYDAGLTANKPAYSSGIVYVGMAASGVTAINAFTGQKIWDQKNYSNVWSGPAISNGKVFVSMATYYDNIRSLAAFDAITGKVQWQYNEDGRSPYVYQETVYCGSKNCLVYAVDANTGQLRWKSVNPGYSSNATNPVAAGGMVFINEPGNNLVALDASTGGIRWTFHADADLNTDPCVVSVDDVSFYPGHSN